MRSDAIEVTDLLWPVDADGHRVTVRRDEALATLHLRGQRRAARLVARLPHRGGDLDQPHLDHLGLRIHRELQRLGEELQMDRRVAALVAPHVGRMRASDPRPVHVVDVGCGLGSLLRASEAHGLYPSDVQLVGVDLNPLLVAEARRLAEVEGLQCRFIAGDALAPGLAITDPERTVVVSTGLLHHMTPSELRAFFAAQAQLGVAGFAHFDIAPCAWSTIGAWIFHRARMREPISRHDGVLSARRAHGADTLLRAARTAAPTYQPTVLEGPRWYPRALDVLRPIVGWRA